jgi:hypothetical protein
VEKLQLQHDFPTNLLIKTYDTLCESCRSIAPLQLLFLENFNLVATFWSITFLNRAKPNQRSATAPSRSRAPERGAVRVGHMPRTRWSGAQASRVRLPRPRTRPGDSARPARRTPRLGTSPRLGSGPPGHVPPRAELRCAPLHARRPAGPRGLKASGNASSATSLSLSPYQ